MIIRGNMPLQCAAWRAGSIAYRNREMELARSMQGKRDLLEALRITVLMARKYNREAIEWGRRARGAC